MILKAARFTADMYFEAEKKKRQIIPTPAHFEKKKKKTKRFFKITEIHRAVLMCHTEH